MGGGRREALSTALPSRSLRASSVAVRHSTAALHNKCTYVSAAREGVHPGRASHLAALKLQRCNNEQRHRQASYKDMWVSEER